ncbi:hypothetical protein D3C86_1260100 [compost metagenome]
MFQKLQVHTALLHFLTDIAREGVGAEPCQQRSGTADMSEMGCGNESPAAGGDFHVAGKQFPAEHRQFVKPGENEVAIDAANADDG